MSTNTTEGQTHICMYVQINKQKNKNCIPYKYGEGLNNADPIIHHKMQLIRSGSLIKQFLDTLTGSN